MQSFIIYSIKPAYDYMFKFSTGSPLSDCINVRRYDRLSMVLLQLKDPLELLVKKREFIPGSWFLSRYNMA